MSSVEQPLCPAKDTWDRDGVVFKNVVFYPRKSRKNKRPQRILHKLCGRLNTGELTAIIGPSGAGKTTLLNILSWRATVGVSGDIWYNGAPRVKRMKKFMGYVMQRDCFFDSLTVEETLMFAARMRYGGKDGKAYSTTAVNEVIEYLGLEKCRRTRVGNPFSPGISGGELKRLNVAAELLVNPSIFFLDEPTSGLDAYTANSFIETLGEMAREYNKTVVASIHQPSSRTFACFDNLIAICQGNIVFQGPLKSLNLYLESLGYFCPPLWNVADFVMELLINESSAQKLITSYHELVRLDSNGNYFMSTKFQHFAGMPEVTKETDGEKKLEDDNISFKVKIEKPDGNSSNNGTSCEETNVSGDKSLEGSDSSMAATNVENSDELYVSGLAQSKRKLHLFSRSPPPPPNYLAISWILFIRAIIKDFKGVVSLLDITQSVLVGFIVGFLWFQVFIDMSEEHMMDYVGLFYFIAAFWGFIPAYSALTSFPTERIVIAKERASKAFPISTYLLAKSFSDMAVYVITPTAWLIVVYPLVGFPGKMVVQTWLVLMLSVIVAHSFGMMVSSMVDDFHQGSVVVSVFLLACMLSSGFYVDQQSSPVWISWLKWISFQSYSTSLFIQVLLYGRSVPCMPGSTFANCPIPITANDILQQYTTALPMGFNILWMLGFLFVCKIVTYLVLRFGGRLKLR